MTLEGVRLTSAVANVTPEVAAVEREVVRNELREQNETGIYGSIFSYLQAAVFPAGHPYARPVIGNHESLSSLTLQDAQRFVAASYRPENVTLVIVGDVDLQAVQPVVERSWPPELLAGAAAHPAAPRISDVPPEPPEPPPAILARDQEAVAAPELWIGWSLPRSFRGEGSLAPFLAAVTQNALSNGLWHDDDIGAIQVRLVEGAEASMLLCRVEP